MLNLQFAFAQLWSQKEYEGIAKIVFVKATDLLLCNENRGVHMQYFTCCGITITIFLNDIIVHEMFLWWIIIFNKLEFLV